MFGVYIIAFRYHSFYNDVNISVPDFSPCFKSLCQFLGVFIYISFYIPYVAFNFLIFRIYIYISLILVSLASIDLFFL